MARLSTPLQIEHLKSAFLDLNPGAAADLIDWSATLDEALTMGENVDVFEAAYPQFKWIRPETMGPGQYEEMVIAGLAEEAEPYGFDVVRLRRLEALQKAAGRVGKLREDLKICRGLKPRRPPRKKVTCPDREKIEVCFLRCPSPGGG